MKVVEQMLRRVADSLYWMSRNIERAENNARVLGVQLIKELEGSEEEITTNHNWNTILEICASVSEFQHLYENRLPTGEAVIEYITFSEHNPNSIYNCAKIARENARMTRDHVPNDLWVSVNEFYLYLNETTQLQWNSKHIHSYLQQVKMASLTTQGIIESLMPQDVCYHIINVGKWLERAENTIRIVNAACEITNRIIKGNKIEHFHCGHSALQLVNGHNAYLKQARPKVDSRQVLPFLISDPTFPRSIRYCLNKVNRGIQQLENEGAFVYSRQLKVVMNDLLERCNKLKVENMNLMDHKSDFFELIEGDSWNNAPQKRIG